MDEKVATRENLRKALKREEEYKIIAHWIYEECNSPIGEINMNKAQRTQKQTKSLDHLNRCKAKNGQVKKTT